MHPQPAISTDGPGISSLPASASGGRRVIRAMGTVNNGTRGMRTCKPRQVQLRFVVRF